MQDENVYKIRLDYYKGIISENDLSLLKNNLSEVDIELMEYDQTDIPMACLDLFTSQINLNLSEALTQAIIYGIITNTIYDILKTAILSMWNNLKGKTLNKLQGGVIKEEKVSLSVKTKFKDSIVNFRLPEEIPNQQKQQCINELFEFAKEVQPTTRPSSQYAIYDLQASRWKIINISEEIKKVKAEFKQ